MGQSPGSTGTIVAGFIVWLAQNRIAPESRYRYPGIVGQFLDWQHDRRQRGQPCGFDTYREVLAAQGVNLTAITEAERVTDLLRRYLADSNS
jgi:hypothetical protein